MNLWDVGDSNPLTAKPIHRFVKAEWFYRPLMLTSQFVAPTGLEPVTPGLKDRCARYRSPFAPRGRSIFLAPTPLKGRHYCLQYRFIVFITLFSNLCKYTKISFFYKMFLSANDNLGTIISNFQFCYPCYCHLCGLIEELLAFRSTLLFHI